MEQNRKMQMEKKRQERADAKSGETRFIEAMYLILHRGITYSQAWARFRESAKKGYKDGQWLINVLTEENIKTPKTMETALINTEILNLPDHEKGKGRGWYFAAKLCKATIETSKKYMEYIKKGCEAGYSWAIVDYVDHPCWIIDENVVHREDTALDYKLLERAASLNNPMALKLIAHYHYQAEEYEKGLSYMMASANLGWDYAIEYLANKGMSISLFVSFFYIFSFSHIE